jgi:phosphoglycolate phosphatase-like HAD superfamily hydrolase
MVGSSAEPVWAFDVDGCLLDSHTGTSLRPGAAELLAHLNAQGVATVLWSAGGADYARHRATSVGVEQLFGAFLGKDERGPDGRYLIAHLADPAAEIVFVDDRPEDLPLGAEVVAVSPYLAPSRHDRGLRPAVLRAGLDDWLPAP